MTYDILWDVRASPRILNSYVFEHKLSDWTYAIFNEYGSQENYSGYFSNDAFIDNSSNIKDKNSYFTDSFGAFFYSKLFESAKFNGFSNEDIKSFFKEKEEKIFVFETSENVKAKITDLLQDELTGFCDINELNNYIKTRIASFVFKLKRKVCQDTKKLEIDIKRLASITSFEYFRSFLKLPSAVV